MNEKLTAAIEALQEELQLQMSAVADTKRMINGLLRRNGQDPIYEDATETAISSSIRADQFYGKPLATAAREYLEIRRNKGAVESVEILQGLQSGGFDFTTTGWKEKDYHRMLAISLAKNTSMFHKLPNGTFGLLSWYPNASARKTEKATEDAKKTPTEADSGDDAGQNGDGAAA